MKNIIFAVIVAVAFAQADEVVHYDKGGKTESAMSKPNHPNSGLYTK